MGLFRRFRRGRHELGAAVLGLPAAAPQVASPAPPQLAAPAPVPVAAPAPPAPRVELGFRDGSTAALAPDSPQARALRAVADLLVTRE